MAALAIELGERLSLLADLAPVARQLLGSGRLDRDGAPILDETILRSRPLPDLQPCRGLERQRAKAGRCDGVLRARERRLAFFGELPR